MTKESSRIKSIFQNITSEKNDEANKEIEDRKFGVNKITPSQLEHLASKFDLDTQEEEN